MKRSSQVRNPGRYVKLQNLIILAFSASLLWCPASLWAKPVSAREAEKAVRGWLKADAQPLGTGLGQHIMSVETFSDENGQTTYYVVYLQPSGFVIVPGDDLVEPIICFAPIGMYDPSVDNPLGALVSRDVPGRIAAVRAFQAAAGAATQKEDASNEETALQKASAKAQNKWSDLQAYADSVGTLGLSSISDVWVAPLVASDWGQQTECGMTCYNYYTLNNWPCGCVATAMAQLMRFHQHPGAYVWNNMPLNPNCSITPTQRQAIGDLCYDAAQSVGTVYGPTGSSAYIWKARDALPNTFGYSNAIDGWYNNNELSGPGLNGMVNPNLDAGYPALLGILYSFSEVGHAVVADGYGYNFSTLYHHLNMGWYGIDDAWYNLPNINCSSPGPYDNVLECIYNIFVSGSGEIISGRVTNETSGEAISGANVTAERVGGGTYNATTNSNGIYALVKVPSASTYTVSLTKSGCTFTPPSQVVYTGTSTHDEGTSGNSWGIDFEGEECSVGAPVLHAEPNTSPGLRNTIWWDAVPDATWYYAECANDADFANTVIGSGWISDTNCTFTGLDLEYKYWYRVKAAPRIESWSQTSQAEFQTDTLVDARATNGGDVVLAGGSVILFEDNFEDADMIGWTPGAGSYTREVTNATAAAGSMFSITLIGGSNSYHDGVSHDLTAITPDNITFYVRSSDTSKSDGHFVVGTGTDFDTQTSVFFVTTDNGQMGVYDGTTFWGTTYSNLSWYKIRFAFYWGSKEIDYYVNDSLVKSGITFRSTSVSSLTKAYLYNYHNSQAWWDEIEFSTGSSGGYTPIGDIVSTAIDLPADGNWVVVDFNATMPANTSLTLDVLDASDDSVILADVASGTDLSGIATTSIKLRANLSTDNPNNTPVLHDWSVSYVGPCQSDWSNVESSLQCDTLCDFDNNNEINFADFAILAGQWQQEPNSPSADIAPEVLDNFVDKLDLAVFVEKWLLDITCTEQN